MYPVLRAMQKEYADRLSILSVMVDDERKDTEEAVASGKLTGNVHWDGARGVRGSISTLWSVTAFPTVYVIDAEGRIASGGHGEELAAKIAELLK
jgi:hypothetical protein